MIFVTVGTHEQPFDRLVKEVDRLKETGAIQDDVFVQYGYGNYVPKFCESSKMLGKEDMERYYKEARIIITHGGPSSFIQAVQEKKIPIVVPRKAEFHEHVNDHQVKFSKEAAESGIPLLIVEDVSTLGDVLAHYDELASGKPEFVSNNERFNDELISLVERLFQ